MKPFILSTSLLLFTVTFFAQKLVPKLDGPFPDEYVEFSCASDDGEFLAMAGRQHIAIYHLSTGKTLREVELPFPLSHIQFLPNSDTLLVINYDSGIRHTQEGMRREKFAEFHFYKFRIFGQEVKPYLTIQKDTTGIGDLWNIDVSSSGKSMILRYPGEDMTLLDLHSGKTLREWNNLDYVAAAFAGEEEIIGVRNKGGVLADRYVSGELISTDSLGEWNLSSDFNNQFVFSLGKKYLYWDTQGKIRKEIDWSKMEGLDQNLNPAHEIYSFEFVNKGKLMAFSGGQMESMHTVVGSLPVVHTATFCGVIDCRNQKTKWMFQGDSNYVDRRTIQGWLSNEFTYSLVDEKGGVYHCNVYDGSLINYQPIVNSKPVSLDMTQNFGEIFFSVFNENTYAYKVGVHDDPVLLGDGFFRYAMINNNGLKNGAYTYGFNGIDMSKNTFYAKGNTQFALDLYGINAVDQSKNADSWVYHTRILSNYLVQGGSEPYDTLYDLNMPGSKVVDVNSERYIFESEESFELKENQEIQFDRTDKIIAVEYDDNYNVQFTQIVPRHNVREVSISYDGNYLAYLQELNPYQNQSFGDGRIFDIRNERWLSLGSPGEEVIRTFFDDDSSLGVSFLSGRIVFWSTTSGEVISTTLYSGIVPGDVFIDQKNVRVVFQVLDEMNVVDLGKGNAEFGKIKLVDFSESFELIGDPQGRSLCMFSRFSGISYLIDFEETLRRGTLKVDDARRSWRIRRNAMTEDLYNDYKPIYFHESLPLAFLFDGKSTLSLVDCELNTDLLKINVYPNGEWLAYNPQGYFDASRAARNYFYYVADDEPILYSQVKERFWEPGLVSTTIKNFRSLPYQATEDLPIYPKISSFDCSDDGWVTVSLTPRNGGIGRLAFFINGKEVDPDLNAKRTDSVAFNLMGYSDYLFTSSVNQIGCVVYNEEGWLGSRQETIYLETQIDGEKGRGRKPKFGRTTQKRQKSEIEKPSFFGIFIGTSKYNNPQLNLTFSDKDAHSLKDGFEKVGADLFDPVNSRYYEFTSEAELAGQPNKTNIKKAFQEIALLAKPNDIVMVFLSGHGVTLDDDFYYLMKGAGNVDLDDDVLGRKGVTLSSKEIQEFLRESKSNKQMLIIDACHSGQAAEVFVRNSKSTTTSQEKALEQLQDKMGVFIMASSESNQKSYETTLLAQGILTYCLLDGMSGSAVEETDDIINVLDLFSYTSRSVESVSNSILGKRQKPVLGIAQGANTFPIGIKNEELKVKLPEEKPQMGRPLLIVKNTWNDPQKLSKKLLRQIQKRGALGSKAKFVYTKNEDLTEILNIAGVYKEKNDRIEIEWNVLKDQKVWIEGLRCDGLRSDADQLMNQLLNITEQEIIKKQN